MKISDSEWVPSTPEETWSALHDPLVLHQCIPGCDSLERLSDTEYAITLHARVGGLRRQFTGEVLLSQEEAPHHCRISFEGTEEQAGLAIGHAILNLQAATHGGTRLQYELNVATGGVLARIDTESLERTGRRLADYFFTRFVDHMSRQTSAYSATVVAASPGDVGAERSGSMSMLSWLMVAGTVVLITLYYMFLR